MNITEISLKRPVTVTMFFTCVTLIGVIGGSRLPLEFMPDIEFPGLQINVPYRNSTPEEVERRITRPVEQALATLSGIDHMDSTSRDDGAQIGLRFKVGEDMAVKAMEARDKLDAVRAELPADLERIQVERFSAGDIPLLTFRISAEGDLQGRYDMLERNLKRRVERLPGVSRVDLYGVEKKEIRIELAADRVAAHAVDLRTLAETLQRANFAMAAGDVTEAGRKYYVKPEGRFRTLDDVGNFVVDRNGLKLSDIADIRYEQPRQTYERHLNQRYAVGLSVYKESGANLVATSDRVMEEIEQVKQLPEMAGIALILFDDQAKSVRQSLRSLVEAGLLGGLFSMIVLYLFLRETVTTLIVIACVPISLAMAMAGMFFIGYSLNVLTLLGLMLSVGMLVDNAVVVNEAIFKARSAITPRSEHLLRGDPDARPNDDALRATLDGTRSVGLAVTLGTLATAIVFLPNLFGAQDEVTQYLSHVATTICLSLAASLLVAVTLVPQLTTRLPPRAIRPVAWIERLSARYARVLEWTLAHRGATGLLILALLGSVAIPAAFVKTEMFGQDGGDRLLLEYNFNSTYPLDTVRPAVNRIENWLVAHKDELEMESVYSYFDIGRAQTVLYLKDKDHRHLTLPELEEKIRKGMPKIAIGAPSFDESRGGGAADALAVQVFGESSEHLREVASAVAEAMHGIAGITDPHVKAASTSWEMRVKVDRDKARLYGLSSQQVAETVAGAMRGTSLRPYRTSTGEIEMRLELRREDRTDIDALRTLPLSTPDGRRIPLSTVAELSIGDVPGDIQRNDRRTALLVQFGTAPGVTAEDAKKRVESVLKELQLPPGYSWSFGKAFDDEDQSQQTMLVNMLLALACIYIVMAALFESVLAPTAIISGIFFSFVGVYWFFLITGTTFSFMAMVGMLVLMGVVVNNGIVLIDHVRQLRLAGLSREAALLQGSRDRLRPILMTASSTVLAMIPLASSETTIGGQGPSYFPMARAIIGGLAFATVVSLVVLPTIYLALEDLGLWGRRVFRVAAGRPLQPQLTEPL